MNIGTVVDFLIFFGFGVYAIFLSVKQKEKLGRKAASVRFVGVGFILLAILFLIKSIIK